MMQADIEAFSNVPDIGETVASSLYSYLHNENNIKLITDLRRFGLTFTFQSDKVSDNLQDYTFLITGTLPTLSRKEAEEMILKHGGRIVSSVSKSLDYLVVGDRAGSKLTKAQKLESIQIIGETELLDMIGEQS